jgi:hypothetical protein
MIRGEIRITVPAPACCERDINVTHKRAWSPASVDAAHR